MMLSVPCGRSRKRRHLASLLCCLLFGGVLPAAAAEGTTTAATVASLAPSSFSDVSARALALNLAADPYWLTLLHYGWGTFGRRGVIDGPEFYLSPTGQDDPQAELLATLKGMLGPSPADPEQAVGARFPARCAWLGARLGIDPGTVPRSAALEETLTGFAPRRVTLVFPAGYLASPPSMFGHTLLLVHGSNESPLLSQAVNYAASTAEGGLGPLGVVKGLFGMYPGSFSVLPYHRKVQEYSDLDQRDIWEFDLNLNPAETRRLLDHLWELRGATADYWFFDENCSFNLLFLLEVARPGVSLTHRGGWWVIPIDTIRWVRQAGMIAGTHFRPSRASAVAHGQAELSAAAALSEDLARGRLTVAQVTDRVAEPATRAQVFDLTGEILHALAGQQAIAQADYRQRLHAALSARAALGPQPAVTPVPQPVPPDQGHGTGRVLAGGGVDDDHPFLTIGWRAAQHDLLDAPAGFPAGGHLEFGNVELRSYDDRAVVLHRLSVLRIVALNPYEDVFRRLSWTVDVGARTERMGPGAGQLTTEACLEGGAGLSLRAGPAVLFALGTLDARFYDRNDGFAIGPELQTGVLASLGPVQASLQGTFTRYLLGDVQTNWQLDAMARLPLSRAFAVDLEVSRYDRWERDALGVTARLLWYY